MLNAGRPENGPARTTFHWLLAFPEVMEGRGGFDAVVGNPPFMGGKKITGALGNDYRDYVLHNIGEGKRGSADIVAYFFLRASVLARGVGFLAVNTIAQGDTRQVGLETLVTRGWTIVRAVRSRPWPGVAGVHIAQVWISRNCMDQSPVLDNAAVTSISTLLSPARRIEGNPFRLMENAGIAFIGAYVRGMGFLLSQDEASEIDLPRSSQ